MKDKQITLIPVGGLANRMRAIESAIALSKSNEQPLKIIWFKDWGMGCTYHELFEAIELPYVTIKEADGIDLLMNDRPRRKNLFVPYLFQSLKYERTMYENRVCELTKKQFDFAHWCKGHNVYVASFCYFFPVETSFTHFRPTKELKEEIQKITSEWKGHHTVGVHIRRTDNIASIQKSPTEAFINRMKKELQEYPDTIFYLATDSEEEKAKLKSIFKEHIITSPYKAERDSVAGMKYAVIEMFLLSSTDYIFGSIGSTYSTTAAKIGGIPFEAIKKA